MVSVSTLRKCACIRTSVASLSALRTLASLTAAAAGCFAIPATLNTALVRIGLPGVTAGNPATSTMVPGSTRCGCSVSIRAPPVPSST